MAEILISNKMTSKYKLIAQRESEMGFGMLVGNYKDNTMSFDIRAKVIGKKKLPFSLNVVHAGYGEMGFTIQPKIFNHLGFTLEVSPHNQMTSRYELVEPPSHIWEDSPVQDSYTLSESPYNSINYGNANSLVMGIGTRGRATPYVQFDLSDIEKNIRIKNAKFRLYYSDLNNTNIDLYEVKENWREMNITYLNAPTPEDFLTANYINNTQERYIEFDVTDVVTGWMLGLPNNGFLLKSLDNITTIFRARETNQPPQLIVEYVSSEPINISNRRMKFGIKPRLSDKTQILFEVEVISHYKDATMGFSVFAHDPDHYYPSNMGFQVLASRDRVEWLLDVRRPKTSVLGFKIAVAEDKIASLPFEIFVPDFEGESNLGFNITVHKIQHSTLGFTIECHKDYVEDSSILGFDLFAQGIYKPRTAQLPFAITAQKNIKRGESNLGFNILPRFTGEDILGFTIEALTDYTGAYNDMGFSIRARGEKKSELGFSLNVSRPEMGFTLIVPHVGSNTLPFTVSARKFKVDHMLFDIEVGFVEKSTGSYIYII